MSYRLTGISETAGAIVGTGALGFVLGLLRFEGRFVKISDCAHNQEQCNNTHRAVLESIDNRLKRLEIKQDKFIDDFYKARR